MLFTTGIVLHRVLTTSTSGPYTALIGISITAFLVVLSYVHCATDELIMHNVTFGTMIAIIGSKTMRLLRKVETPFIRKKVSGLARAGAGGFTPRYSPLKIQTIHPSNAPTPAAVFQNPYQLYPTVIFISGYVIWLLDNRFCGTLISLRRYVEMPWSFALELHGWYVYPPNKEKLRIGPRTCSDC
jgi:dihydroceramidase